MPRPLQRRNCRAGRPTRPPLNLERAGDAGPFQVPQAVWPVTALYFITALYFGPAAVAAYRAWGRPASHCWQQEHGDPAEKPGYVSTAVGASHCGAGCILGDIIAEFAVFGLGATVAGLALGAEYIGGYLAALALGIIFQYFAIAPMRGLSLHKGLIEAAKVGAAPLTAFEIGLSGWMALMFFVFFPPRTCARTAPSTGSSCRPA